MSTAPNAEERASAAYQLFHNRYEVRIPYFASTSAVEEKGYGSPIYKDKSLGEQIANELVHTTRTIAAMSALAAKGVNIILVNRTTDAIAIYSIVMRHIADMARHVNNEISLIMPGSEEEQRVARVVQDLEMLEEFAYKVYPVAQSQLPYAHRNVGLAAKLKRFSFMSRNTYADTVQPELGVGAPTPISELLTSSTLNRSRTWG